MRQVTAIGRVEKGKFVMIYPDLYKEQMNSLSDGPAMVTVKRTYKPKSWLQDKYYHGLMIPRCMKGLRELGHDVNELDTHAILKAMFNKKTIIDFETNEPIASFGGSTALMTTSDMMAYFEQIVRWAAEFLNITIPEPDPLWKQNEEDDRL